MIRSKIFVFATHNDFKLKELRQMLPSTLTLLSLHAIGCFEEIPEEGTTITENAIFKAHYVSTEYRVNCFADDTGLEVEALNNAPGVYSARYAGPQKNTTHNIDKLLNALKYSANRAAQFKTVIALYRNAELTLFEGVCKGIISMETRGLNGFGYDPVFIPEGYDQTFAELSPEIKNRISHRADAVKKLITYLKNLSSGREDRPI